MTVAPVIGYAGIGHLGLSSAAAAAEKGFEVVGFDPVADRVAALGRGQLPVFEPGLSELVAENAERLRFTADAADLAACDLVYVAPDVATDEQGESDLSAVSELVERVDQVLDDDAVLVVLSQIPPGFTRGLGRGKRALYCQVETLILGRAVERALNPERFIVGCADPGRPLAPALAAFLERFDCPVLTMGYESAELTKIAINCCLVASISAANTLAELCEALGVKWSEIVPALKLDRRIGPDAYLAPGLGIAGGNLERDLATVCRLADAHGTDAGVVRAWLANSRHRRDWALRVLHEAVLPHTPRPAVAILGLAYKANTRSTRNSPAVTLIESIKTFCVRAYDPAVTPSAAWHPDLTAAPTALAACADADVVMVMTPWDEFRDLDPAAIAEAMRGRTVIDPYAVLGREACTATGLDHFSLGSPRR